METQLKLWKYESELIGRDFAKLIPHPHSLEREKEMFISSLCSFVDSLNLDNIQLEGRPRSNMKDVLKSLLMMSFHGFSYRRTKSDLKKMHEENLLEKVLPKSTLNDYANKKDTLSLLSQLVQLSALFFIENEDTLILDSTTFPLKMYAGGHKKVYNKKLAALEKCRKIHVACLKNSRAIAYVKATAGTVNDSPLFEELVRGVVKNGFVINSLLADAGYSSKNNYAICKELGIIDSYIDFRSNAGSKRGKSDLWRDKIRLFKENKELWHESYRFRVLIEGIFSVLKKKSLNYLRSRNETAQDVELLLKCLVYNLTLLGKYQ